MWGYDLEYANESAAEHHVKIMDRPNIPAPVINYTEINIPGRDGILYSEEKTVDDIAISVQMNFSGRHQEWFEYIRSAKAWLLQSGQHKLKFEDDSEYFYRVKKVEISETERECRAIGRFTVTFFCYGDNYLHSGTAKYMIEDVKYNPYHTSHPIYIIQGEGVCVLKVNGNQMTVNLVGQNVTIDTELMIAYRMDGTMENTSVTGDYEDLYLKPGYNEIEITEGFEAKVIPNWRSL